MTYIYNNFYIKLILNPDTDTPRQILLNLFKLTFIIFIAFNNLYYYVHNYITTVIITLYCHAINLQLSN